MDFLNEMQKIAKCEGCGTEFLMLGDVHEGEKYFCSLDCIEKGTSK